MKKGNISTVSAILLVLFVGAGMMVNAQTGASGMLNTASTELNNATTTLKTIFGYIFMSIAGGAFIYAAYTAFFDQQQMRRAMIGLIAGILFGTIGAAMALLN